MTTTPLAPDEPALPRRFGQYLLFDKIGEGGMARIYLGRKKTGFGGERLLVIKQILPMLSASEEFCRLLVDEAKLSALLSHKNVVQVNDLGREQAGLYIAMEYVEGLDLKELLLYCSKKRVPLPVDYSLHIVLETLRGLDYAHRKLDDEGRPLELIHRDVSPSNVLISIEGEVKLCDFGIARAMSTGDLLPDEAIQGKAGYMAPEVARGDAIDQRADLFSAGIILYELLSGRRVYRSGSDRPPILEQARIGEIQPLPEMGYPEEQRLRGIVGRALARDPSDRYESAQAMLQDLEAYVVENRLSSSPMRLSDFLTEHFAESIVARRREWERAAKIMEETGSLPPAAEPASPPSNAPSSIPPAPGNGALPSSPPAAPPVAPPTSWPPPHPKPPRPPSRPPQGAQPSAPPVASGRGPDAKSSSAPLVLVLLLVVAAVVALVVTR